MRLQVAGREMSVELTEDGAAVQLYDDEGDQYSFPILLGEAGFARRQPSGDIYTTHEV